MDHLFGQRVDLQDLDQVAEQDLHWRLWPSVPCVRRLVFQLVVGPQSLLVASSFGFKEQIPARPSERPR